MNNAVSNIRYQTNIGAVRLIALPNTPVKPQSKTAACICNSAFFMYLFNKCKLIIKIRVVIFYYTLRKKYTCIKSYNYFCSQ